MVEADIVEGLLQHLGVQKVHTLAHDVGDTVAQVMLARFNDRSYRSVSWTVTPFSTQDSVSLFHEWRAVPWATSCIVHPEATEQ